MGPLAACPFCRQLFPPGEASACPDCGIGLEDMSKLPLSYEAGLDEPAAPVLPHLEVLPWTYPGRNRALLLAVAMVGLFGFFAPWVNMTAPELRVLSGFDLAHLASFFWAPAVAWFVCIPLVATRRSIHQMRGARVAVAFLASIALLTVAVILVRPPPSSRYRVVRIEWCWGIYFSGATALIGLLAALRFGGSCPPPLKVEEEGRRGTRQSGRPLSDTDTRE